MKRDFLFDQIEGQVTHMLANHCPDNATREHLYYMLNYCDIAARKADLKEFIYSVIISECKFIDADKLVVSSNEHCAIERIINRIIGALGKDVD